MVGIGKPDAGNSLVRFNRGSPDTEYIVYEREGRSTMNTNSNPEKKPWFGPKRYGLGFMPRTWQGWLCLAIGVAVYIAIVIKVHLLWPDWFVAKTNGIGWNPSTWQGYAVLFAPPVIGLLVFRWIYLNQKKG